MHVQFSEIGSLTLLDALELHVYGDVREPISPTRHQAVQPGAVKLVLCGHSMHLSYMHQ